MRDSLRCLLNDYLDAYKIKVEGVENFQYMGEVITEVYKTYNELQKNGADESVIKDYQDLLSELMGLLEAEIKGMSAEVEAEVEKLIEGIDMNVGEFYTVQEVISKIEYDLEYFLQELPDDPETKAMISAKAGLEELQKKVYFNNFLNK